MTIMALPSSSARARQTRVSTSTQAAFPITIFPSIPIYYTTLLEEELEISLPASRPLEGSFSSSPFAGGCALLGPAGCRPPTWSRGRGRIASDFDDFPLLFCDMVRYLLMAAVCVLSDRGCVPGRCCSPYTSATMVGFSHGSCKFGPLSCPMRFCRNA